MGKGQERLAEDDFVIHRGKNKNVGRENGDGESMSKLDKKKARRAKEEIGLPPEPVLVVRPEPIVVPEIIEVKNLEPESKPETEKSEEIKDDEAVVKGALENKIKLVKYEDFSSKTSSLQTREELLEYLSNSGEFKLRNEKEGSNEEYYFPAFSNRVKDVFAKELLLATLKDIPVLYEKVWEIIEKEKTKKIEKKEDIEFKKNSQVKRNPTQKNTDVFEMSSKNNGNRRVYTSGSVPDDAEERADRIKNEKAAKKSRKNKEPKLDMEDDLEKEKTEELDGFEKEGREYYEKLKDLDWSKYNYDEDHKKDLVRIELEALLGEIIKEDSRFFKVEAKKVSKDIAKKIIE